MKSIYEKALGNQFQLLHPKLQEKFRISSNKNTAIVANGMMDVIKGGFPLLRPFFRLGLKKRILFPERGENIPFVIENYAYRDSYDRECVAWLRSFQFPNKARHFDATMIYSEKRKGIVDYFGTHHDFVSELTMEVLENGGLRILSTSQSIIRFGKMFRLPNVLKGIAEITEWYDDLHDQFHVHVCVKNPLVGKLFEYIGTFQTQYVEMFSENLPYYVKPKREEIRE